MSILTADRLKDLEEYYFSKKLEEIRALSHSGEKVINLGIGSPDLKPASSVIEAATSSLQLDSTHGYAPYRSSPELRASMAKWYQQEYGVSLDPQKNILPLLGSKEGILYTSLAFLNSGDQVLIPDPGYPTYSSVARMIGARPLPYNLTQKTNWQPDLAAIEAQDLSRVKLMWLNYPHMPTGALATEPLFKTLVDFGRRHNILICNDNPYSHILNPSAPLSLLNFDSNFAHTLELNSLSKSFNMAGWRVGMALSSKTNIDAILKIKSNVDSGMFSPIQAGASAALALGPQWHEERNAEYKERRSLAYQLFDALDFKYDKKQVGLFLWAKAPDKVNNVETYLNLILEKLRVFITPGFVFGKNGERFARISLCASTNDIQLALKRLSQVDTL